MELRIFIFMILIGSGLSIQLLSKYLRVEKIFDKTVTLAINLVYYVLIPLAFTKTYAEQLLSLSDLCIAISVIVWVVLTYLSMKAFVRRVDEKIWNSLYITSCFPNAIFLGFPISMLFFGTIRVASTYGLVMLILNILVPDLIALKRITWKKLFTLPALIGFLTGVSIRLFLSNNASIIIKPLYWSPTLLSYTATFLLGCRLPLKTSTIKNKRSFIIVPGLYRFTLSPLITSIIAFIFSIDFDTTKQMVLVSSMPPAVMNTLIAHKYGWLDELVAYSTVVLTFISLALYTVILFIF